ncbi:WD40 repeat-like protein [Gloeophyllum trabeum ATCC 11539]|uniref:WD40 repeat-like protein n=1 Tax=Gloeophyllum trabeum (strain ATCC 11539 / FP-39264 / Madison 617) TaxID=670483 RepID=S7RSV6_GLOTA|nr:WD40 repeat-like protein [Gloeophyllum trabeum ATCC 11539]EPQ57765.1 WD40 repeat-like protein [Gloeophyllum trabeum ATCC 11539]
MEDSVQTRWFQNDNPRRLRFPAHGKAVVTCLLLSHDRIISASDEHSIHIYSLLTGQLIHTLKGHTGGVWCLATTRDTLVSGSSDSTVRVWDLSTGRCTHVFKGHTNTVRCLTIVKPEWLDWPKEPLIVSGSRDNSMRVWLLPRPNDKEYTNRKTDEPAAYEDVGDNPYHKHRLAGHEHAVRALAARGRTLLSGSFDCTVRVWDIITGQCRWVLHGHTQRVYTVALDAARNKAYSGSMDGTVRIWDLHSGECRHILTGHTSLVGLLGLSPSRLVSAAADDTLRVWNPDTGELQYTLSAHTGAITCFQHDDFKVVSGSEGSLKMWDIRDGREVRDLLPGITGVRQVVFKGPWCVAASVTGDGSVIDVWDFAGEGDDSWVEDDSEDEEDNSPGTSQIR